MMNNYDSISKDYSDLVERDPAKIFVQYPWTLRQLAGRINDARILDVGCGDGALSRVLAKKHALVCGYDNSIGQIGLSRLAEQQDPLGIEYILADPRDIVGKSSLAPFDSAIAVTVLHYATDCDHLAAFFQSTYCLLRSKGLFTGIICNPDFKRLDQRVYNRRYVREPNGQMRVDFFDHEHLRCSAWYTDFSRSDYETAASATGWPAIEWLPVYVTEEGKKHLGDFWKGFEEDCPYVGFRLQKTS